MNKIFKTVWNRVRRCYVAVNETVTSARQATGTVMTAVGLMAIVSAQPAIATEVNSSNNISGNLTYNDVVFQGAGSSEKDVSITTKLFRDNIADGCSIGSWANIIRENKDYFAVDYVDHRRFNKWVAAILQDEENFYGLEYQVPQTKISVDSAATIKANTLRLGKSTANVTGKIGYILALRDTSGKPVDHVTNHTVRKDSFNATIQTDVELVNNGGRITAGELIFGTAKNAYTQNSGALTVGSFSGGGTATFKSGSLDVDTLTSDVKLTTENTRIDADTIDLNSKTWTSSNSNLSTGLDQVANFQQIIAKAQSLLIGSNDASRALNASAIKRNESVNGLLSKFKNNVTWSGGAFHFKGTYTQTVANQARQLIRGTYGSNVGVSFEQIVDDPTPADITNGLTAAIANAIMVENGTNGGAVFTEHKLNALANPITVGAAKGENNVDTSIGFVSVNGKSDVSVTGAKELVFLGEGNGSTIAEGKLIADNGTLRLGTKNTRAVVGGTVADVDLLNNGTFMVERGTFVAKDVAGEGNVLVSSGDLTIEKLDLQGRLTNKGNLHLAGVTTFENGANTGTLWSSDALINGTFSNDGGHWHLADKLRFGERAQVANGSGTLETVFGNLFDNGTGAEQDPLNTISLNASVPEEFKTVATDLFTHYVPGTVKDDVLKHMTFAGNGKVIISDASLTTTQRDDLVKAFKEKFSVFPRVFRS